MSLSPHGRLLVILSVLALAGCGNKATSPESSSSISGNSAPAGSSAEQSGGQKASAPASTSMFAPKPIVIPAETGITVTADQAVSSKTGNSGDHFDASVAEAVTVGEKVVIPKGAKASGTVTVAKSAGRFKGNAELSVTLSSVTIEGREYQVNASTITETTKGRGKRTAVGAGGGAAVGALIGAIAGRGKGAAIGAAAGAGAGTAGAAMTGERDITIGAETKLNFKLKDPLEVTRK